MSNYKAVLFDFDGTLMNSLGIWEEINRKFFKRLSIPYNKELLDFTGLNYSQSAMYIKNKFHIDEDLQSIMHEWAQEAICAYRERDYLKPYAKELILALYEQGFRMAIGTNNTRDLVVAALDTYNLTEYFEEILTSCEIVRTKPYPDVYLKLKEDLGVNSFECVVFEDTIEGLRAARSAGMYTYAIKETAHGYKKEDVERYCDRYIDSFAYFKDNLTNLHEFL